MQKSDPLIRTKLRLPFTRPGLVARPRLRERIAQGLRGPLTLITAPAGFGKTTLLAVCIHEFEMPVVWLSLDKDDNQVERFLRYLVAALRQVDETIGQEAAQLMAGMQQAPTEAIVTGLINDLDACDVEIALVLDDYQSIRNRDVHEGVTFLLEHCPTKFHLVIATRSDPALPIARLRSRGQAVELRAADLRFTEREAAQFLNDVMGLCLDAGSVALLEERTEGWIAGLQMAALSMRDREDVDGFIEGFSGTHRYILDYLLEEVLAGQPPEIQGFLLYTSILERLSAPLCDSLLGALESAEIGDGGLPFSESLFARQSAAVLEYLERGNLFLVPLDDERVWYRYHHLFADLLRARLHQIQPDLVSQLHRRAATWLVRKEYITEAIHHLFAADEADQAADLIARYGPAYLAVSDTSVLQMAESLPREMILARPILGLHLAWFHIIRGRIGKALPLLKDLAPEFAGVDPKSDRQWMGTFVAVALAFLAPPPGTSEPDCLPDYALVEEIPSDAPILRNAADILYGMALGRRGALDRAVEVSVKCLQREKTILGTKEIPTVASFLSRVYLMQGRLNDAAQLCREYLDPFLENGRRFNYTAGSMQIDLGEVLYEWNYLEDAEQHIRAGLRTNESWRNIMTDGFGLVVLARLLQAKGDYAGAMRVVEEFERRMREHSQPREFDEDVRTLRVRIQLASGNLQSSALWADRILYGEDYGLYGEYYRLTLARIRLAQGRYDEVGELLAGTSPPRGPGSQISKQLESDLLLAAAYAGQRRLPEALELLESCLELAEPEGYIRVFLDVSDPARELLAAYIRSAAPLHKDFAQQIIAAYAQPSSSAPQPAELVEALTERELEVLHLISQGLTNKQIAQKLVVAPGTIKAHAASIYGKLDVANRTEAVSRARQLDILP